MVQDTCQALIVPSTWVHLAHSEVHCPTRMLGTRKHENGVTWALSGLLKRAPVGRSPYLSWVTEVSHMAHFWMSYGRCTMPGSPMGRSEGLPRRWTG